jgi:hypothetical protein
MLIGYMRASSADDRQLVCLQRDTLLAAGVDAHHLYADKVSGAKDAADGTGATPRTAGRVLTQAAAVSARALKSLAGRRLRLSQASVRSTIHLRGSNAKPLAWSERFTIASGQVQNAASAVASLAPA